MRALALSCALPGLLVLLVGCGESDPEAALEEASAELEAARESLGIADGVVQKIRSQMRQLEQELADAERVRREAQGHVSEAEALVGERASDDVLFRAVQRQLLEDSGLADAVVTAHVSSRVVTLRGRVGSTRLRDRAVEVAAAAPGVARVVDELQVPAPGGKLADRSGRPPPTLPLPPTEEPQAVVAPED